VVDTVLLPCSTVGVVTDYDHDGTEDGEDDGKNTTAGWHWELWVGHGHCDSSPGGDGWSAERTGLGVDVQNARVGLCEKHEERWSQEDCNNRSKTLGDPLLLRRGLEQETNTEVADKIGRLVGADGRKRATEQVESLSVFDFPALALGGATKNDLRGLRRCGQWGDVSDTSALDCMSWQISDAMPLPVAVRSEGCCAVPGRLPWSAGLRHACGHERLGAEMAGKDMPVR
jgi:hypothetical protein